jgi:hypothetical protein
MDFSKKVKFYSGLVLYLIAFLILVIRWLLAMHGFPQFNANDTANIVFWHFLWRSDTVRIIPETPKPLLAMVYGILADLRLLPLTEVLKCAALAFLPWFFFTILIEEFNDFRYAIISFFLTFAYVFNLVKPDAIVPSEIYSIALLFLGYLFVYRKRWILASIVLLLMGLMRNDFWFFSALFVLYGLLNWRKLRSWARLAVFLPLLSPLLWVAFDWRVGGSFNYSSQTVRYVSDLLGFSKKHFSYYVEKTWVILWNFSYKNPVVLLLGLAGLVYCLTRRKEHLVFLFIFAIFPLLEIVVLYFFFEPPPLSSRFYVPLELVLFAMTPFLWKKFFEKRRIVIDFLLAILVFGYSAFVIFNKYDKRYLPQVYLRDSSIYRLLEKTDKSIFEEGDIIITHIALGFAPLATKKWDLINRTYSLLEVLHRAYNWKKAKYVVLTMLDRNSLKFYSRLKDVLHEIGRYPGIGIAKIFTIEGNLSQP